MTQFLEKKGREGVSIPLPSSRASATFHRLPSSLSLPSSATYPARGTFKKCCRGGKKEEKKEEEEKMAALLSTCTRGSAVSRVSEGKKHRETDRRLRANCILFHSILSWLCFVTLVDGKWMGHNWSITRQPLPKPKVRFGHTLYHSRLSVGE